MLLVMYPLILATFVFARLLPSALGWPAFVWLAAFAGFTYAVAQGAGLKLAALVGLARPAPAELAARVDALAARVGAPKVPVYVLRTPALNAFALPRMPAVAVTSALLSEMTPEEIDLICAHELGHVTESKAVKNARFLLLWLPLVILGAVALMHTLKVGPYVQLGVILVVVQLKLRYIGRFVRNQEERADQIAHAQQREPGLYGRALEKLYRLNGVPAVLAGRGSSHPHLYDRMIASGLTPDFPRPTAPAGRKVNLAAFGVIAAAMVCGGVFAVLPSYVQPGPRADRGEILARMVLTGPNENNLTRLALMAFDDAAYQPAGRLYAEVSSLSQGDPLPPLNAALAFALAKDCRKARHWLKVGNDRMLAESDDDEERPMPSPGFVVDVTASVKECGPRGRSAAH
jgi:Zn-dependent protease with chaperone function